MAGDLGGEVAELLQAMIRNACVNDGTPESGHEQRNAEVLRGLLDGRRARPGGLRAPARAAPPWWPRSRAATRTRPALALLGPHRRRPRQRRGLAPRPLRRRDHRRRGVGPGRGRHAQPHGVDGRGRAPSGRRGIPARGRPPVHRRGRRGGPRHPRRPVADRAHRRRGALRLPHHRGGRLPHGERPTGSACPSSPGRRAPSGAP